MDQQEVLALGRTLLAAYTVLIVYALFYYFTVAPSCFRMMRKAGMKNIWMAWVPYCNFYAYGDLADHYNLLCEGKATSYAKKLLTWQIVASALAYPTTVLLGAADLSKGIEAVPMDFWVFLLACLAAGVVSSVFYFISLHKIYRLFAPHCAVGLTVLTILVPVSIPVIFLAIARREPCFPFTVETEPPPVPPADMDTGYYSI